MLGTMNLTELILENHQLLAAIRQEENWLEIAVNISVISSKEKNKSVKWLIFYFIHTKIHNFIHTHKEVKWRYKARNLNP